MENNLRNNQWLKSRFQYLYDKYFSDIEITNKLIIKFGRPCKTRLGSIKPGRLCKDHYTHITINGHFINDSIPEYVINAVLAHEFMHYAHGFASSHAQAFRHPHQGGVVDWDLKERGLSDTLKLEKKWMKENWKNFITDNHPYKDRKRKPRIVFKWI